jgi:outer membrane protein assembly factor BamE (lipoprotein component of BamABCDE complex)
MALPIWAAFVAASLLAGCAGGPFVPGGPPRSDALFSRISPGMTQGDVERIIGPPDDTMSFPLSHTVAWDYLYQDTWGYTAEFSVTFDPSGRAVSKFSKRLDRHDLLTR